MAFKWTRFWNKVFPIVEWLEDLGELIVLLDDIF